MNAAPMFFQVDVDDCGPTCVRILTRGPRRTMVTGPANLKMMLRQAGQDGVQLVVHRVGNLQGLPEPAICRLDGNHYIVVTRVGRRSVRLFDPMRGTMTLPRTDFVSRWDGIAVHAPQGRNQEWLVPILRSGCQALGRVVMAVPTPALFVALLAGAGVLAAATHAEVLSTVGAAGLGTAVIAQFPAWSQRCGENLVRDLQQRCTPLPRVSGLGRVRLSTADAARVASARAALDIALLLPLLGYACSSSWWSLPACVLGVLSAAVCRGVDALLRPHEQSVHVLNGQLRQLGTSAAAEFTLALEAQ